MKGYIRRIILVTLFSGLITSIYLLYDEIRSKESSDKFIQRGNIGQLYLLDSTQYSFTKFPAVLIHFNSDCEICHLELKDIKESIALFEQGTIVMMSTEPIEKIASFANSTGLDQFPNVVFTKINHDYATANFGTLTVPQIFIYGKDGVLRKEFKGEAKAVTLAKYLY